MWRISISQNNDLQIRIATGTVVPTSYYTQFNLTIAGVTANIRAYILPMRTSYTLLLGRRWMNQVGLMGEYKRGPAKWRRRMEPESESQNVATIKEQRDHAKCRLSPKRIKAIYSYLRRRSKSLQRHTYHIIHHIPYFSSGVLPLRIELMGVRNSYRALCYISISF